MEDAIEPEWNDRLTMFLSLIGIHSHSSPRRGPGPLCLWPQVSLPRTTTLQFRHDMQDGNIMKILVDWRGSLCRIRRLAVAVRLRGPTSDMVEHGSACGIRGSRGVRNFKFSETFPMTWLGLLERIANQGSSLQDLCPALCRGLHSPRRCQGVSRPLTI